MQWNQEYPILCSACLLGLRCKYDGTTNTNAKVLELIRRKFVIPVCPEQLGGLTTPREPAEAFDDGEDVLDGKARVVTRSGKDVTANFIRGAEDVLKLASLYRVKEAILKARSPSCGCGQIYDGTFSGKLRPGNGVTTALLIRNGIYVLSEESLFSKAGEN